MGAVTRPDPRTEIEQVWQATRRSIRAYESQQEPWQYMPDCLCLKCVRRRDTWQSANERRRRKA